MATKVVTTYCTRCDECKPNKVLIFERFGTPIPAMPEFDIAECVGVRVEVCQDCLLPSDEVVTK